MADGAIVATNEGAAHCASVTMWFALCVQPARDITTTTANIATSVAKRRLMSSPSASVTDHPSSPLPHVSLEEGEDVRHPLFDDGAVVCARDLLVLVVQFQFLHRVDPQARVRRRHQGVRVALGDDDWHAGVLDLLQDC